MKLLFDENLSWRLVQKLAGFYPNSIHVLNIKSIGSPAIDLKIWEYARDNDFVITTYDEDFYELQALKGFPPKIIWLRFGNLSTDEIAGRLLAIKEKVIAFVENPEAGILEVY